VKWNFKKGASIWFDGTIKEASPLGGWIVTYDDLLALAHDIAQGIAPEPEDPQEEDPDIFETLDKRGEGKDWKLI